MGEKEPEEKTNQSSVNDLHDSESNAERIRILEEEVELLREEMDYIIDRKGLRELMDNE